MRESLREFLRDDKADKPVILTDQYVWEMTGIQLIAPVYLDES
jgi:hypothetical protein